MARTWRCAISASRADRDSSPERSGLPPYDTPFSRFTRGNGVLAERVTGLHIENVRFREIAGFAVLVSRSRDVAIDRVQVRDSGSRNAAGRNNATGGILLEEGTQRFPRDALRAARHPRATASGRTRCTPRRAMQDGVFAQNRFAEIGRDAIQVGHATDVRVEENTGTRIGFPVEDVDIEGRAIPVALDTAGNVERCSYARNRFEEIDGKCIDLDGFHDGEIRGNVCVNRAAPQQYRFGNYGIVMNNSNPDMQSRNIRVVENLIDGPLFGGIFVIGTGHLMAHNRLLNMNSAIATKRRRASAAITRPASRTCCAAESIWAAARSGPRRRAAT